MNFRVIQFYMYLTKNICLCRKMYIVLREKDLQLFFFVCRQLEQEIENKRQHQQQCQRDLDEVNKTIRDNEVGHWPLTFRNELKINTVKSVLLCSCRLQSISLSLSVSSMKLKKSVHYGMLDILSKRKDYSYRIIWFYQPS